MLLVVALGCAAGMARLWHEQRQTLAALAAAETARASERQALLLAFSAADQIAGRALARLSLSSKASPEAERDREFCRKALALYEKIAADHGDDPSMRAVAAATFHRIGFIRTILAETGARAALTHSIELYEGLIESSPSNEELRSELVVAVGDLVICERTGGHPAEAALALEKLVAQRQGLVDDFPASTDYAISLAYYQINLCEQMEAMRGLEGAQQTRQGVRESALRAFGASQCR
jgi:hypothetical protein